MTRSNNALALAAPVIDNNASRIETLVTRRETFRNMLHTIKTMDRNAGEINDEAGDLINAVVKEYLTDVVTGTVIEQVSADCLAVFGAVPKADGTAGKTPKGRGKDIRDLVKLVATFLPECSHVTGPAKDKADALDVTDTLSEFAQHVLAGELGAASFKAEVSTALKVDATPLEVNAEKLAALAVKVAAVGEASAATLDAYRALVNALNGHLNR